MMALNPTHPLQKIMFKGCDPRNNNLILRNKDSLKQSILTESIISEEMQKDAAAIKWILLQISTSTGTISELLSSSAVAPSRVLLSPSAGPLSTHYANRVKQNLFVPFVHGGTFPRRFPGTAVPVRIHQQKIMIDSVQTVNTKIVVMPSTLYH
jgi:hypothetical protein